MKQELFNKMVLGLNKQKAVSREGNTCVYRGKNGTKCAVGMLIPDNAYHKGLESQPANRPEIISIIGVDQEVGRFLTYCQIFLHDCMWNTWNQEEFEANVEHVCEQFELENPLK